MRAMLSVDEVSRLIQAGERILLAGDEGLLRRLPHGDWVGGTSPYFIGEAGGVKTDSQVFASTLPAEVTGFETRFYTVDSVSELVGDEPPHGFSFVIIPAFTAIHQAFAENIPSYDGVFDKPLVGWVSGVAAEEAGRRTPKVVDGRTGQWAEDKAICLHAELRDNVWAEVGIVNPFRPGEGDVITVDRPAFSVNRAMVNGRPVSLGGYFTERGIDVRLPLVANYSGAMVNVSVRSVDSVSGTVEFFAPLFPHIDYRLALPIDDYAAAFAREIDRLALDPVLSMNCVLNYLYGNLEGKRTGEFVGPITFGEIAYGLLNQTLVYMQLRRA
jgi:hypothetical protein